MKGNRLKYIPIILGVLFFVACKNRPGASANKNMDTDPVFAENPKLKDITEEIHGAPNNATLYFERGNALHKLKLDTLAIKDYKRAAALDTTQAQYYSAVGDILFEHKDITGSIEWLQKAINKDPTDHKAQLKVAKLFLYLKDYSHAFAAINVVMRKNVYDPEAYFLKGMIYKDMKDTAKAISNFQTAVQVAPDYREAVVQLGLLFSEKKDPIALTYFDNAYRLDSSDVVPIYGKGLYYQTIKNYPAAIEEFKKCVLRNSHYIDPYFNMGYIYMQEDSIEKSFRQYDIVTKLDPANPTAYYDRGVCNELMSKTKDAIADYRTASTLDTGYSSPREALKKLGAEVPKK